MFLHMFAAHQRRKLTRYKGSGQPLLALLKCSGWLIACVIAMTISFRFTEGPGWSDSFFHSWQTVTTVGYGNHAPSSFWGRASTITFGTLAIILFAPTITAYIGYVDDLKYRKRAGMTHNVQRKGLVLFNFPGDTRLRRFLEEIAAAQGITTDEVCLVDNQLTEIPQEFVQRNVHFVRGDILDDRTYELAHVATAAVVLVFPRDINDRDSDINSHYLVQQIQNRVPKETRIICILVDWTNRHIFKGTRATLIANNLSILAAVQEICDEGTAPGIQRLLLNTEGEDPHTITPSDQLYGRKLTWAQLMVAAIQAGQKLGIQFTVQAIVRKGEPVYCPGYQEAVLPGDRLYVVGCHNEPLDWPTIEHEILQNV